MAVSVAVLDELYVVLAAAWLVMVCADCVRLPPALICVPTSLMLLVAVRVMLPPAEMPEVTAVVDPSTLLVRVLEPYRPTSPRADASADAPAWAPRPTPAPACASALALPLAYRPAVVVLLLDRVSCTSLTALKLMSLASRFMLPPEASCEPSSVRLLAAFTLRSPPALIDEPWCVVSSVDVVLVLCCTRSR